MATNALDRLHFAQGGQCFFCRAPLPRAEASVEHLVARAKGGNNSDDNCVVCCKSLNRLLGSLSVKDKMQIVLNQGGAFRCPNKALPHKAAIPALPAAPAPVDALLGRVIANLERRRGLPRNLKTLTRTITALQIPGDAADKVVQSLIKRGVVKVTGSTLDYAFPSGKPT